MSAEREDAIEAVEDAIDAERTARYGLGVLEDRTDEAMRRARRVGLTLREIGAVAGVSHEDVRRRTLREGSKR
jgi:DNA-directed RNA polymerase specialized sigma subunit